MEEPFSLARSIERLNLGLRWLWISLAWSSCLCRFVFRMSFLMAVISVWSTACSGSVLLSKLQEELSGAQKAWEEFVAGLVSPKPPSLTGRARRSRSCLEQGARPVRAGIRHWWIAVSRGSSRS